MSYIVMHSLQSFYSDTGTKGVSYKHGKLYVYIFLYTNPKVPLDFSQLFFFKIAFGMGAALYNSNNTTRF